MSDGSAPKKTGGSDAMEDELESGKDKVQEHAEKLSRVTKKATPTVMTDAGKVQMGTFEKEWPNVQPMWHCRLHH